MSIPLPANSLIKMSGGNPRCTIVAHKKLVFLVKFKLFLQCLQLNSYTYICNVYKFITQYKFISSYQQFCLMPLTKPQAIKIQSRNLTSLISFCSYNINFQTLSAYACSIIQCNRQQHIFYNNSLSLRMRINKPLYSQKTMALLDYAKTVLRVCYFDKLKNQINNVNSQDLLLLISDFIVIII